MKRSGHRLDAGARRASLHPSSFIFHPSQESGQSLILAIMAMFLLTFLGGVFIAMLARNMSRTERHASTVSAQYLAEAGIRYADTQLTYGPEGADWRPAPMPQPADPRDPDYRWIRPYAPQEVGTAGPSGGFTRVPLQSGRFLVRVSYNPSNLVTTAGPLAPDRRKIVGQLGQELGPSPLSKYIVIESIGREGIVDPADPTTFQPTNLRRELMALKPIGITDYIRFITNKDNETLTATLGVSAFPTTDGRIFEAADPSGARPGHQHNLGAYYGPIRVNGNLQWKGHTKIYLNVGYDRDGNPVPGGSPASVSKGGRQDSIEVAGQIRYSDPKTEVRIVDGQVQGLGQQVYGSNDRLFRTMGGLYRDGAPQTDPTGSPRGITRLEPPDLNAEDPGTRLTRWRLLTRNSQPNLPGFTGTGAERAAAAGLGAGIYIDNRRERQLDTSAFTLVDDWLQPGNTVTANWRGHIYRPPGVQIVLLPVALLQAGDLLDGLPVEERELNYQDPNTGVRFLRLEQGAIRITRSDGRWLDRQGRDTGQLTQYFQYPLAPYEPVRIPNRMPTFQNGVIFAEGNIRVRGKLPMDRDVRVPAGNGGAQGQMIAGTSLTLVSGGTIYIEGPLLKGEPNEKDPQHLRRSSLALLARDYVALNATAYFAGLPDTFAGDWNRSGNDWYTALYLPPHDRYDMMVRSAVDPRAYPEDTTSEFGTSPTARITGVRQALFLQHTAESHPGTQVSLTVNGETLTQGSQPFWSPFSLGLVRNTWGYHAVPLLGQAVQSPWAPNPIVENWLQLRYQPTPTPEAPNGLSAPYWLSKAAVVPLDVKVEAVIYAMDRSFFIIPGVPFNNVAQDTRAFQQRSGHRAAEIAPYLPEAIRDKYAYPYYNEPLDIKITLLGAIAENRPAGEQAEETWTRRWGWTPLSKASGAPTAHGGDGLAYQYDALLRATLRYDLYGRPLPGAPRLPVSRDLVYFGESSF